MAIENTFHKLSGREISHHYNANGHNEIKRKRAKTHNWPHR